MKHKQREKDTEPYLVEQIKKRRGMCIKMVPMHIIGLPDRLILLPRMTIFFVETKSEGDKPRKIQLIMHKKIRALGFDVHVADTKEKIDNIIEQYGF